MISRSEFLGSADFDDDRGDRFEFLDADNNGRIERGEWHGSNNALAKLDQDGNGVLSRREVAGQAAAPAQDNQFASLDYNRSGVITTDEWHWSRRTFDQRDINRDGRLTRRELDATGDATTASNRAVSCTLPLTTIIWRITAANIARPSPYASNNNRIRNSKMRNSK